MAKVFRAPMRYRRRPTNQKPFKFYQEQAPVAVLRRGGRFVEVPLPSQDETDALVEGRTWFTGGRDYLVDDDTAGLLVADGFEVSDPDGFGVGPFSGGFFGGGD